MQALPPAAAQRSLAPYAARLACALAEQRQAVSQREGTLVKVDLSGFTRLSERLARSGPTGAEELTAVLDDLWTSLVGPVLAHGGDVLQFGGDALAVWFEGPGHPARAVDATWAVQQTVRERPAEQTPAGPVRLRMSAGAASGRFTFALVGERHRELMVLGPAATAALQAEAAAAAGQLVVGEGLALEVTAAGGAVRRRLGATVVVRPPGAAPGRPADLPTSAAAAPFLAPQVRELELAGPPLGEHRRATVAFVLLAGTDALAADDPDLAAAAAARVADAVERAAERYDVCWTATDVATDGVVLLLVGGAPVASEQDEERVLRAARAVVEECPDARIGVHSGRTFAGDVGHPQRRTYAVLGDTTNTAARLMSRAAPGQVLASRATWDRSDQDHTVVEHGLLQVKGRRTAVEALAVGLRTAAPGRSATHDLPLVGRADELSMLQQQVAGLVAGAGSSVLLLAPAGQGKSRLVAATAAVADAAGAEVALVTASPYESASPYGALRPLLRRLLGVGQESSADVLQALLPDQPELSPLLALPLGVEAPSTPQVDALEPQFVQVRRNELLAAALLRRERPLLLVLEDLHVCDAASHELLDVLARALPGHPVCVLATGREVPDGWPQDDGHWRRLDLSPLDRAAARRLLLAAAGDRPVDDADLARALDDAAGNPLFLRELVDVLAQPGAEGLPVDLQQVVSARLDRLAPADRALLRQAAVLGPAFTLDDVATVLDDDALRRPVHWAGVADFVEVAAGNARFRHDLYRRAAYEGLAVRRRRHVHAATAALLVRRPAPDAAMLAAHLHAAQRWDDALHWSQRAAQAARADGALPDALRLLELAGDAGRRAGAPHEQVAELDQALGEVAELVGRFGLAEQALKRAARHGPPEDRARRAVLRAAVLEREGRYRHALTLLTQAERRLDGAHAPARAAVRRAAQLRRSVVLLRCGRLRESASTARAVAADAARAGDRTDEALALLRLEMAASELGLPERFEVGRQALRAFEGLDAPRDLAMLLGNLGVTAYFADDWQEAAHRYAEAAQAYARAGDAVGRAFAVNNAAEVLCDQGYLEQAAEQFSEARRVFRAAGSRFGTGCTASSLGRIAARRGEVATARALLGEALVELADMPSFAADTRVRVLELALLAGEPFVVDQARQLCRELEGADVGTVLLAARRLAAVARARAGDAAGAAQELEDVLVSARETRALYEAGAALAHLVDLGHLHHRHDLEDVRRRLGVAAWPDYQLSRLSPFGS